MKNKKNMWGYISRVVSLVLAFAVVATLVNPMTAQAKTNTAKVKYSKFLTSVSEAEAVASVVKKGSNKIVLKRKKYTCLGYVKFVAPKTKTYTFTFSGVSSDSRSNRLGFIAVQTPETAYPDSLAWIDASTKGGTTHFLRVAQKTYKHRIKNPVEQYLSKRSAKMNLQEGQVVYLHYDFSSYRTKNMTSKLVIK